MDHSWLNNCQQKLTTQGVLGRFCVTLHLAFRKLQLQLIDGNRPDLNFHKTISLSLQQPILTLLRTYFKWDAYDRINLMNKRWKRTRNTCIYLIGTANSWVQPQKMGKQWVKIHRGNTHSIKMHVTWWREYMCKGRYIVVWPWMKSRERRGD